MCIDGNISIFGSKFDFIFEHTVSSFLYDVKFWQFGNILSRFFLGGGAGKYLKLRRMWRMGHISTSGLIFIAKFEIRLVDNFTYEVWHRLRQFLCMFGAKNVKLGCSGTNFWSRPPKGTSFAGNTRFDIYIIKVRQEMRLADVIKNKKTETQIRDKSPICTDH